MLGLFPVEIKMLKLPTPSVISEMPRYLWCDYSA